MPRRLEALLGAVAKRATGGSALRETRRESRAAPLSAAAGSFAQSTSASCYFVVCRMGVGRGGSGGGDGRGATRAHARVLGPGQPCPRSLRRPPTRPPTHHIRPNQRCQRFQARITSSVRARGASPSLHSLRTGACQHAGPGCGPLRGAAAEDRPGAFATSAGPCPAR
jgi:hypothetical protein